MMSSALSQQYPDTLWIQVTFYDFHADGTNPEFEPNHNGGLKQGMVADTLSADRKPVLGPKPFFNYYVDKWFRPWTPGDSTVPVYTDRNGTLGSITTLDHDTAFKNIVIVDSLPFIHAGDGVYEFERSGRNGTPEFSGSMARALVMSLPDIVTTSPSPWNFIRLLPTRRD